jgi:hypothetical protein
MKNQENVKNLATAKLKAVCGVCLAVFALFVTNASASESNQKPDPMNAMDIERIETKVVDGFLIGVTGSYLTTNTSPDELLVFVPWTTNGSAWFVVPVEPEYAYQVELLDTNGVAVPKTELGKKVGTKFLDFEASKNEVKIKRLRADKKGKAVAMPILFRPSDLFQIDKPGIYTLRIRFQILTFPRTGPNRRDYTNDLIRFPPLDYPLVKTANSFTNQGSNLPPQNPSQNVPRK